MLTHHVILLRRKLFFPLVFCFCDLGHGLTQLKLGWLDCGLGGSGLDSELKAIRNGLAGYSPEIGKIYVLKSVRQLMFCYMKPCKLRILKEFT